VRVGEAGPRKERNEELTSKRAPIDLTPLLKIHKLAIDLRSPITANSPPYPTSHLQTATNSNKMSTQDSGSSFAAGSCGRIGPSSATTSASTLLPTNASSNNAYNHRQFSDSLPLAIAKEKLQMPLLGTMGALVFGGADVTKLIKA